MPRLETKTMDEYNYPEYKPAYDPDDEKNIKKRKAELREIDEKLAEILSAINIFQPYVEKKLKNQDLLNDLKIIKERVIGLSELLVDPDEMEVARDNNLTDNLGQIDVLLGVLKLLKKRGVSASKENISGSAKKLLKDFMERIEHVENYLGSVVYSGDVLKRELATHEETHHE